MLSIKKLKVNKRMSEETLCFSADVHFDGKKVGEVCNRGHGGPNEYYWPNPDDGKKLNEWAKSQPTEFDFEKLDQLIDDLISEQDKRNDFMRWCRKSTVFRLKSDIKPGEWRTIKAPYSPKVKQFLITKYGNDLAIIMNDSIEAAMKVK